MVDDFWWVYYYMSCEHVPSAHVMLVRIYMGLYDRHGRVAARHES